MRRVFVYEFLSGGGPVADTDAHRSELLAMGRAMRDAITADLLRSEDYAVSVATCEAAAQVPDPARIVVPHHHESAFDFVTRQADAHQLVWVVAPERKWTAASHQLSFDRDLSLTKVAVCSLYRLSIWTRFSRPGNGGPSIWTAEFRLSANPLGMNLYPGRAR